MFAGLLVWARIIAEVEGAECESCGVTFDPEYQGRVGGVHEGWGGQDIETPTLCGECDATWSAPRKRPPLNEPDVNLYDTYPFNKEREGLL